MNKIVCSKLSYAEVKGTTLVSVVLFLNISPVALSAVGSKSQ